MEGNAMQTTKVDKKDQAKDTKDTKEANSISIVGKNSCDSSPKKKSSIEDSQLIHHFSGRANGEESSLSESIELPETSRRTSRNETMRQDSRKLKSVTLGRMGKMFRLRSPMPTGGKSTSIGNEITNVGKVDGNDYGEQPTRKEKTNSLGRMFKLVDKDGTQKIFPHPRAGSLTRMFRKHTNHEEREVKSPEDASRGIFSRMFSQLKGHSNSGNSRADDKSDGKKTSLPPKISAPRDGKEKSMPRQSPVDLDCQD